MCLACVPAAVAQQTVSEADIARARAQQRTPTDAEVAAVARKYQQAAVPGTPTTPNVDALPLAPGKPLDLGQVAAGYGSAARAQLAEAQAAQAGTLSVFITLTLPEPTLDRLFEQAARAQATLVLRGLEGGSMRATLLHVQRLVGKRQVAVQIDPQAFERYAVQAVPAFVLAAAVPSCAGAACPATGFAKAAGDVSLDYALDRFAQLPAYAAEARRRLQTLRGRP
nr:type-F conjugative transfer system pilin assembly protein TrbC [Massilia sp. TS11]